MNIISPPGFRVFAIAMISISLLSAAEPVLVLDRGTAASLILPETASPQLERAAGVLQRYVEASTGVKLPVRHASGDGVEIHLGQTAFVKEKGIVPSDLAADGFILEKAGPSVFVIAGATDWGTEFGVYEFLERYLGVRWLAPTELFTEVPKRTSVRLPDVRLRIEPAYHSRGLFPIDVESDPEDPRRSAAPLWYAQMDVWGRLNKLHDTVDFTHNLKDVLPPSRFAATNPEFYPVIFGKHFIPPDADSFQWQPNFSAPGLAEATAAEIIRYFDSHPDEISFSLGINDSYRFDESKESKARRSGKLNSLGLEDISDDYYQWVNDVAAIVRQKHPGKLIGLLAYLQVLDPPARVQLDPSIVPFITYELTRWNNPEFRELVQRLTLAWAKESPSLGWYDYVYGSLYLVPRFFPRAEQKALSWGASNQVKYYYAEMIPNWGEGPNPWVLTKLLWNPHQDVDVLLDDWYRTAVGEEAAPSLRKFYEIWEKFWESEVLPSRWYTASNLWLDFSNTMYLSEVPLQSVEDSERLMAEVVARAGTPAQKARAEALAQMWKVYRLSVLAYQGDEIWRTADLSSYPKIREYLGACAEAVRLAAERLALMGALQNHPLFAHSIYRFSTLNMLGEEWGTSSLWTLLPLVQKNDEVRLFLERLAASSAGAEPAGFRYDPDGRNVPLVHKAPEVAALVLAASRGDGEQLLVNPSFEDGLEGWKGESLEAMPGGGADGKTAIRISGSRPAALSQKVPYKTGKYYVKLSAFVPKENSDGKIRVSFTARNDDGVQIGPLLPIAAVSVKPGEWSTLVMPFRLGEYAMPATTLAVDVETDGFAPKESILLDDLGLHRIDDRGERVTGAGPDGL